MPKTYPIPDAPVLPNDPDYKGIRLDTTPQLSASDAVDNTPEFQNAVRHAWDLMQGGKANAEAGFTVSNSGAIDPVQVASNDAKTNNGHISMHVQSDDTLALHTHPDSDTAYPSDDDVKAAKTWKRPIYIQSRQGLFAIDAKGKVTQLKLGTGWLYEKKKSSNEFSKAPYSAARGKN
jgi:proteasome lid subunit RPN8/RPN11